MKNKKQEKQKDKRIEIYPDISVNNYTRCPETTDEMVNSYGTYNIQPTADNNNDFPAIAQGENKIMKNRSLHFFRDADDERPAAGGSDNDCIQ